MTAPAPTKPEPFRCQRCRGTGRYERDDCLRCDGDGTTYEWDCLRCADTFDVRDEWSYTHPGKTMRTPHRVTYTVGCREYTFCANCAPAEAIGDGAGLRAMLADVRALLCVARVTIGQTTYDTLRVGIAIGHAASIEAALLDLALWAGVAVSEP